MRERVRKYMPAFVAQLVSRVGAQLPQRRLSRFARLVGFETAFEAHRWVTAYWTPEESAQLMAQWEMPAENSYNRVVRTMQHHHVLHRLSAADISSYMVDDILTKADRASMSVSLEARVPLLDYRVVEFVAGLPVAFKYDRGHAKRLLRELAYRHIPRALLDRPKKGFGAPVHAWLRGPLRELMQTMLSRSALNRHGLLNADYVQQIQSSYLDDNRPYGQKLWNLLVFQLWYERYMS